MSEELSSQSELLRTTIAFFKIKGDGNGQAARSSIKTPQSKIIEAGNHKPRPHAAATITKGARSNKETRKGMISGIAIDLKDSTNGSDEEFERF
jgi:hypothetical protein